MNITDLLENGQNYQSVRSWGRSSYIGYLEVVTDKVMTLSDSNGKSIVTGSVVTTANRRENTRNVKTV